MSTHFKMHLLYHIKYFENNTVFFYQINDQRFFFGIWLTVILLSLSNDMPFRGFIKFTCNPTLIFFVSAPSGKTACTCGTTVLDTIPPSGPIAWTSCLTLDTTAKYCGKSCVTILVIRPEDISSNWLRSEIIEYLCTRASTDVMDTKFIISYHGHNIKTKTSWWRISVKHNISQDVRIVS